ncbi:MAG: hypothetical protein FWH45_02570 [Methanomassiliicoccaceae archaeon]|nr:hypothetical protein [Methanomassiliicoccaceae archaeon]
MLNAATFVAAAVVLMVIALSAYFTYRSLKRGGCSYCGGCPKAEDPACEGCRKRE